MDNSLKQPMHMKKLLLTTALVGLGFSAMQGQVNLVVPDSSAGWLGFMAVNELPANGGGAVFQSGWGVPDLATSFDDGANTLSLLPNSIGDPDPFWYVGGGAPGSPGNKQMTANLYIEEVGTYAGQTVNFSGTVLSDTMGSHTTTVFIRDFAPDFSSVNETTFEISGAGPFSISLATINDPLRPVQYGFQTVGENVWITDIAPFGSVVIGTVPEPSTYAALLGFLALGYVVYRRRKA